MSRRLARFTQVEMDRIFKAAAKTRVNMHIRVEPDGTIDVETTGAISSVGDDQDTPERISELIRNAS